MKLTNVFVSLLLAGGLTAQAAEVSKQGNTVTIRPDGGPAKVIRLQIVNDNIIRVQATPEATLPQKPASLMLVPQVTPSRLSRFQSLCPT